MSIESPAAWILAASAWFAVGRGAAPVDVELVVTEAGAWPTTDGAGASRARWAVLVAGCWLAAAVIGRLLSGGS